MPASLLRLAATLISLLLAAPPLAGQYSPVHRGSIQLAGTAQFSHFRDIGNDAGDTFFEIAPRISYFVVPGLAINANLRYQHATSDAGSFSGWGIGPGLTYYLSGLSQRLYPFVSGRTLFTRQHSSNSEGVVVTGGIRRAGWSRRACSSCSRRTSA